MKLDSDILLNKLYEKLDEITECPYDCPESCYHCGFTQAISVVELEVINNMEGENE